MYIEKVRQFKMWYTGELWSFERLLFIFKTSKCFSYTTWLQYPEKYVCMNKQKLWFVDLEVWKLPPRGNHLLAHCIAVRKNWANTENHKTRYKPTHVVQASLSMLENEKKKHDYHLWSYNFHILTPFQKMAIID